MIKIEIVAIGTELLKGTTVNTNATEISQMLYQAGYPTFRHTTVSDDPQLLKEALKECLKRSDVVITTGGLGPTCDDLTRQVAAELYESDFYFDEKIAKELRERYGNVAISVEHQASIPKKATTLKNPIGTALGLVFQSPLGTLILIPGVPSEMRHMLKTQVLPYLEKHFPKQANLTSQSLHFFRLSESDVDPLLRQLNATYPEIDFGIYPSHGVLKVVITAPKNSQNLNSAANTLTKHFAKHHYTSPSGKLEEAIHLLFLEKGWTLSLAESCTGGSVSAALTKLPGASKYFLGSIVAYSYELKTHLLDVSNDQLLAKGAVSEDTVIAMVEGLLEKTKSEFGVAISGIAGPDGGTPDKPVGTVWFAVARKGHPPHTRCIKAPGNREMIIQYSTNVALSELLIYCNKIRA